MIIVGARGVLGEEAEKRDKMQGLKQIHMRINEMGVRYHKIY